MKVAEYEDLLHADIFSEPFLSQSAKQLAGQNIFAYLHIFNIGRLPRNVEPFTPFIAL